MKKGNVVYIVQGYEKLDEMSGRMTDVAVLEIYANSTEEAFAKAKKYIAKSNYRVERIIEK